MITNKKNLFFFFFFLLTTLLFFLLRLPPLLDHTVPYTYDQGRDFLKTAEIVMYKNPTFIGPTTGIVGLYHGAWWYYILTIPFIIFSGSPISFYFFVFFIQFLAFLLLLFFINKEFNKNIALFIGLIIAVSPYFIFSSFFVGNNIMAIPSVFVFAITTYYLLKKKPSLLLIFFNGLFLGLINEFELSFGMFLIPSYFISILLFQKLRQNLLSIKHFFVFLAGLLIIFLPRLLFEFKNGWQQTKVIIGFFINPKLHTPKPYLDLFKDRIQTFQSYYDSIFSHPFFKIVISVIILGLLIHQLRKKELKTAFQYYLFILLSLFFFSTLYKDTFWSNYYEGIQYFILLIFVLLLGTQKFLTKLIVSSLFIVLLIYSFFNYVQSRQTQQFKLEGLITHEKIVAYIQNNTKNRDYCVDIYTPPVIPYTYQYLFLYNKRANNTPEPKNYWVNNRCWYIIERDDYLERQQAWVDSRIPKEAKIIKSKQISDVRVELWEKSED